MFFKKEGRPEINELVICTVQKILPHAAFVSVDEYNNLEAMLHVSEVSSRWVRNIKDYLNEGKKIVCKILEIKHGDHVDVSLKRVTNAETKRKLDELKSEQRIEKLIEAIALKLKEDPKKSLQTIGSVLVNEFGSLADFSVFVKKEGAEVIKQLKIPQNWINELHSQISEQLKSQMVILSKDIEVKSSEDDGIERLKEFFSKIRELVKKDSLSVEMKYISAPKYRIALTAKNYKEGDLFFEKLLPELEAFGEKHKVEFKFLGEAK